MKYIRTTAAAALALTLSATVGTAAYAAPVTATMAPPAAIGVAASAPADLASARSTILAETNAARAAAGLPALAADVDLNVIAQACSELQARNGVMAHCDDYASKYPAGWNRAAENVASGQSIDDVVDAWLASPGHRANILDPAATHIGVGFARDVAGRTYFTQDFAAYSADRRPVTAPEPQPQAPAAPVAPPAEEPAAPEPTATAAPTPEAPTSPTAEEPTAPSAPTTAEKPTTEEPTARAQKDPKSSSTPDFLSVLSYLWAQIRAAGLSLIGSAPE